jgi:hypothetical protein
VENYTLAYGTVAGICILRSRGLISLWWHCLTHLYRVSYMTTLGDKVRFCWQCDREESSPET